jgi:hypothetical protein
MDELTRGEVAMDYRYLQAKGALNEATAAPRITPVASRADRAANWRGRRIPPEVLDLLPESLVREDLVFPIAAKGETVTVAAVKPDDIALADKISFIIARKVRLIPASREEIAGLIARHFGAARSEVESVDSMFQSFTDTALSLSAEAADAEAPTSVAAGPRDRIARPISRLSETAHPPAVARRMMAGLSRNSGLDPAEPLGEPGVFTYVVEEGQRVLMRRPDGTMDVLNGPKRVWRGRNVFRPMQHFVAHPGDYLIIRHRDGRQEHLPGPAEAWLDPRIHQEISREEALQVAAKEAVVVYSQKEGTSQVQRRIEYGPTLFIPRPGEWLHTFAWHSSEGGSQGARKVPRGLVFQKLWMLPDQMYHDVTDVRTADDAVLTIRLMLFFELLDITTMLETTHDPIGDFVNAATSDVVDFTGRHDFESFKRNTDKLNELETYRQLIGRSAQCGYRINKVVYRGYGAPDRLQQMHDQAIEARTRLQLDRATEEQAQALENFRLDSQMLRAGKRRGEQTSEVEHELELAHRKQEGDLLDRESRLAFQRQQAQLEAELRQRLQDQSDGQRRGHLAALRDLGLDLTAYLTQGRADRVIELRGAHESTHVHLDPAQAADGSERPDG